MAALICISCGAALNPGAKFCAKCGTPVAAQQPEPELQLFDQAESGSEYINPQAARQPAPQPIGLPRPAPAPGGYTQGGARSRSAGGAKGKMSEVKAVFLSFFKADPIVAVERAADSNKKIIAILFGLAYAVLAACPELFIGIGNIFTMFGRVIDYGSRYLGDAFAAVALAFVGFVLNVIVELAFVAMLVGGLMLLNLIFKRKLNVFNTANMVTTALLPTIALTTFGILLALLYYDFYYIFVYAGLIVFALLMYFGNQRLGKQERFSLWAFAGYFFAVILLNETLLAFFRGVTLGLLGYASYYGIYF
jgi:hypothetical protein